MRNIRGLFAAMMVTVVFLSACTYTPDQMVWTDIEYPKKAVQLEIVNSAGMSARETKETLEAITQTLRNYGISVNPAAGRKLIVEVVGYNEQSTTASILRWATEFVLAVPLPHFTSNRFDARARVIREDGSVVEATKLAEISEATREFEHIRENMAQRIAYFTFATDVFAKIHERGYDKVSTNK